MRNVDILPHVYMGNADNQVNALRIEGSNRPLGNRLVITVDLDVVPRVASVVAVQGYAGLTRRRPRSCHHAET
jgi:hypothetical protein